MTKIDQLYEEIRTLSVQDRLRLVERVVHDVAEAANAPVGQKRPLGIDAGKIQIADDFDAPLPDGIQSGFDGEP